AGRTAHDASRAFRHGQCRGDRAGCARVDGTGNMVRRAGPRLRGAEGRIWTARRAPETGTGQDAEDRGKSHYYSAANRTSYGRWDFCREPEVGGRVGLARVRG